MGMKGVKAYEKLLEIGVTSDFINRAVGIKYHRFYQKKQGVAKSDFTRPEVAKLRQILITLESLIEYP